MKIEKAFKQNLMIYLLQCFQHLLCGICFHYNKSKNHTQNLIKTNKKNEESTAQLNMKIMI